MSVGGGDSTWAAKLVRRMVATERESEVREFKHNNADPQAIGEYVSALANSAAIAGVNHAYVVWGIEDGSKDILGTNFDPWTSKIGNEELVNWLVHSLKPQVGFQFTTATVGGHRVVVLRIPCATNQPVLFRGVGYIRIGSYTKKLTEHPEEERRLWRAFDSVTFERRLAASELSVEDVLGLLDYRAYFRLLDHPVPTGRDQILDALVADNLIAVDDVDEWSVTNLGASLLASDLSNFDGLVRKATRVVLYGGTDRRSPIREQVGRLGYAVGFEGLVDWINGQLPTNEYIDRALRRDVRVYPDIAIRELVANALIHQDFAIPGTGPMIEIFDDRLEITNPGRPLVDTQRFVDLPPRSRNEALASLMRRFGVCEERGSGWDRIAFEIEVHQLPAPDVQVIGDNLKVVIFGPRPLAQMGRDDRIRAVYLHACLRYVSQQPMTNASVRERFGIEPRNAASATRLINDAVSAELVAPYDPSAGRRYMKYVPFWASADD